MVMSMRIAVTFAACALIWGSTFLAIRFGNEATPPVWGIAITANPISGCADLRVARRCGSFEAEQKARQKAHNDRAALRRKALAQRQRPA